MKLAFCGHEFLLHPSGTLLWPEQELLIVSDLHLEKSSHFAQRGFFLPPYDSLATLNRLFEVLEWSGLRRLLILGDCFHDAAGYERLPAQSHALFERLRHYDPVWISGNHDGDFVPAGIEGHDNYALGNIIFRHQAAAGEIGEISGHFHPKAALQHKGGYIARPCFIEDNKKMIVPAFGSFTGGLDVRDPAIAALFPDSFNLHILGLEKIYSVRGAAIF